MRQEKVMGLDTGEGCSSKHLAENGHHESRTSVMSAGLEASARGRRGGGG